MKFQTETSGRMESAPDLSTIWSLPLGIEQKILFKTAMYMPFIFETFCVK